MLRAPTSPITVPANHSIAGSVTFYGPCPRTQMCQPTTALLAPEMLIGLTSSILTPLNATDQDLAYNRASYPEYCLLGEVLRTSTSPTTAPANHSISGSVKCYGPDVAHKSASQLQYCRLRQMLKGINLAQATTILLAP